LIGQVLPASRSKIVPAQIHQLLAIASALAAVVVGIESALRVAGRSLPGQPQAGLERFLMIVLLITAAGGLGLLVGGARPREVLHFVYAVVAVGAVPVAGSLARGAEPRRRAIFTLVGALITFVVILRLFGTG
jgi:hypothetical protein